MQDNLDKAAKVAAQLQWVDLGSTHPNAPIEKSPIRDWNALKKLSGREKEVLKTLPNGDKLMWVNNNEVRRKLMWHWEPRHALVSLASFNYEQALRYKEERFGWQSVFSLTVSFFNGCCGLLLIDHINTTLNWEDATKVLKLILAQNYYSNNADTPGTHAHLYVSHTDYYDAHHNVENNGIKAAKSLGKKLVTFGNPTHGNRPLDLYLLSSDLNSVLNPEKETL